MESAGIIIKGKVQNVGFRYFVLKIAERYGIHGFVKNEADGSVYIEAEGLEPGFSRFLHECSQGPGWARVNSVDITELPPANFIDFRVK